MGNTEEDTSEGEHSPETEEDVMSPLPRQEDNKDRSPDVSTDPILVEANLPDPGLPAPAPPEPPPEPTLPTLPDSEAASLITNKQCFQPRTERFFFCRRCEEFIDMERERSKSYFICKKDDCCDSRFCRHKCHEDWIKSVEAEQYRASCFKTGKKPIDYSTMIIGKKM